MHHVIDHFHHPGIGGIGLLDQQKALHLLIRIDTVFEKLGMGQSLAGGGEAYRLIACFARCTDLGQKRG